MKKRTKKISKLLQDSKKLLKTKPRTRIGAGLLYLLRIGVKKVEAEYEK